MIGSIVAFIIGVIIGAGVMYIFKPIIDVLLGKLFKSAEKA